VPEEPETLTVTESGVLTDKVATDGVTVTIGVAGVDDEEPPPQPTPTKVTAAISKITLSIFLHFREPTGARKRKRAARALPPAVSNQPEPFWCALGAAGLLAGDASAVVVPVVLTV
jgi:hypothetical protein